MDESYDLNRDDSLRSMIRDFYSRKMLSTVILVWSFGILFMFLAVYSGIQFFSTESTRSQIMYAAMFIVGIQMVGDMKVFAWQMMHRNRLLREIKRLELQTASLVEEIRQR